MTSTTLRIFLLGGIIGAKMKIGIVGPSYQQRSLPFDAQRSVNLYPVADAQGKETASMYGTPGLLLFANVGTGPIRQMFRSTQSRTFAISGSQLYEFDGAGIPTLWGSLNTSSGNVLITENPTQMVISDGVNLYVFTYATDIFTVVTDPDLPSVGTADFIDGYIVANENNTGRFYISAINDALSWNGLDFATAESSPDNLSRVINAVGQLWLFGDTTTEIWTNRGTAAFPFGRIAGAKMEVGILSPYTALALDNSVFWVGRDLRGYGIVYRANGFTPQRISTETIEIKIQSISSPEQMKAWTYQQDGHIFYVITGGGLDTSLVYDLSTQLWHERAYLNQEGDYEQHRGSCCVSAYNMILVGDRDNGDIYSLSLDVFSDNGDALCRDRIYTHLIDEDKRIRYNSLVLGYEVGVGLQTGQGSNPQCSLRISRDGGKTWSTEYSSSIGRVGQYQYRVVFRRLGIGVETTFRIRSTDPVKTIITGSYLN